MKVKKTATELSLLLYEMYIKKTSLAKTANMEFMQ